MNGYERFMAALRREEPDRVPIWELIINEPTKSTWGATSLVDFVEQEDLDGITIFEDGRETPLDDAGDTPSDVTRKVMDEWGVVWGETEFDIPYPLTGPIRSASDLASYTPPDPDDDHRLQGLHEAVDKFKGERAIVFLTHDGFEFPHYLRSGMDHLLMDYVDNPGLVHDLAEITVDFKIRLMKRAVEAGADVIVSGDDYAGRTGPFMSPAHFREFIFPYLKRSVDAAHDLGVPYIKHTDGNLWPIMDQMVDAGIDAIDPLEPIAGMDVGEMKARYGDRLAVIGNIDVTELLPSGTEQDVEEAVKETIAKGAPGGGYILASSNSIHPAVKPGNYRAMVKAGRKWGNYPLDQQMVEEYREKNYVQRWLNPS